MGYVRLLFRMSPRMWCDALREVSLQNYSGRLDSLPLSYSTSSSAGFCARLERM